MALREFNDDILVVDPDEQRKYHPEAKRWQQESPYGWSQRTNADAGGFAGSLRDAGAERRVNLLVDTTLGDTRSATRMIEGLQKAGYEVEIRVMAAHRLESEHGIDSRFTDKIDLEGYARDVPLAFHDKVYPDLPGNVDAVAATTHARVRIYDRGLNELYDSRRDVEPASAVLREARDARLQDPEVTQQLRGRWQAQADWHRNLPERIVREEIKLSPTTAEALQREQLERGRIELSAQRAEAAATIDALIRPGATPAREPIPGFELPPLNRAGTAAGLAGLGALAAAADAVATGQRLGTAYAQDNPVAVRSEATQFIARGAGGAAAGFTPAAMSVSGGPALALAVADGYLLAEAYERGAQFVDRNRIVFRTDRDNVTWEFTGKQWIRDDLRADLRDDNIDKTQRQTFSALPDKARELSYLASIEAVSQAIGKAEPRHPFTLPASANDAPSTAPSPWQYQAHSEQWTRTRYQEIDPTDPRLPDQAVPEIANTKRAAELDREALRIIDRNIIEGPANLAAQYQIGHKRSGFDTAGETPPVVRTALDSDTLEASNGRQYWRDAQGQWSHDGEIARGNLALELNLTRERLMPALEQYQARLAETPAWQPPTPQQQDRAMLHQAYVGKGVDPTIRPEQFDASYLAVQRTREATGVTAETTSLALGQNANGTFTFDSPIQHLRQDPGKEVRVAAITSPDDIALALSDVRARERSDSPAQASPEQTITQTTPQERDVREQVTREANRQGLSQDEVQQAVQGATATIVVRGASSAHTVNMDAPLRQDDTREREVTQRARTDAPAQAPPDFAPSQQGLRDLRDPQHEGHHALDEMQYRARLFETQQHIQHGSHTERLAASMLAFAVENKFQYSDVRLVKDQDTGQVQLEHARYGLPTQRFPVDLAAMSSQPIEATSQRINEMVSHHNGQPASALERTQEQAQGLGGYALYDKVLFGFIRGGTPGHISDNHVALAVRMAKEDGMDANNIARVSMVGDQIRMVRSGPDEKTVLVDVSKPAPPLQDSVNAVNTLNQQQAQTLAQQQDQLTQNRPTQDDPDRGPKGPKL